jgi:hypothetical protein
MSNQFKTKEFKELQAKWYAKLEKKGFVDVEQDEDKLKAWHSHRFQNQNNTNDMEAKQEYYRMAGIFLYEHEFKDDWERKVWELHSDGVVSSEISKILKKLNMKHYEDGVYKTVKDLAEVMVKKCQYKR